MEPRASRFTTPEGRKLELPEFETIWWRRPRQPPDIDDDDTRVRSYVASEWEHFIDALEACAPTRWVNLPSRSRLARDRARQLQTARDQGLTTPKTLMTNDPSAVRELIAEGMPLVYKRMSGASRVLTLTRALTPADVAELDALPNCPALFQELIEARLDIRATVIGSDVYAAEIHSQEGDAPLDWRLDHSVPFAVHRLDETTARQVVRTVRALGLEYGAVDLRLTPKGEYVFLEVNPSGQFLFVELLAGIPLSARMASFLLGRA